MLRLIVAGTFLVATAFVPATADEIKDKNTCMAELANVKQGVEDSDVAPKHKQAASDLVKVLEHLCEAESHKEANSVAHAIRLITALE